MHIENTFSYHVNCAYRPLLAHSGLSAQRIRPLRARGGRCLDKYVKSSNGPERGF
uniref:Uncharacterized protein n=1 Tax=Inoviridae sp. ctNqM18 TaxID=2825780 RepID=A0A8S5U218_9VIRU|nr:MAG TPA: hypothetical protein [Inoviridae sp. ctNqM18]